MITVKQHMSVDPRKEERRGDERKLKGEVREGKRR